MRIFLSLLMMTFSLMAQPTLQQLESNNTKFALLNADIAHEAYKSTLPNLRALFALYPKIVTLVVHKDSNISNFQDITNNRYNIYYDAKEKKSIAHLLGSFNLKATDTTDTYDNWKELERLLGTKQIDGFITLIAHPDANLQELLAHTGARIIPLFGKRFDQLNQDTPYILKSGIPKNLYHLKKGVKSIGVKYLLVTTEDENSTQVETITSDILTYREKLKHSNPLLRGLTIKNMLENLAIPQHKKAIKAFNKPIKSVLSQP